MKARLIFVFAVLALITAQAAGAEVNLGAGVSYEGGNSPISSVLPLIFVETVFPIQPWETFGLDFSIAAAPASSASYFNGLSAGPELFFASDLFYRFPPLGPAELSVLVGVVAFKDYENRVNGIGAQTGLAATFRIGSFFIQGRGLYRPAATTGIAQAPIPLGAESLGVVGGYSFR